MDNNLTVNPFSHAPMVGGKSKQQGAQVPKSASASAQSPDRDSDSELDDRRVFGYNRGVGVISPGRVSDYEAQQRSQKLVDIFGDLSVKSREVEDKVFQLEILREALTRSEQGFSAKAKNFLGQMGIPLPGASNLQLAQAIISEVVPRQRVAGSGTTSDRDMSYLEWSLPKLINTREGNELILNATEAIASAQIARGRIADAYLTGEITAREANRRLRQIKNPLEGFIEQSRAILDQQNGNKFSGYSVIRIIPPKGQDEER